MKVLFVTRKFPPSVGGMELSAKGLSDALSPKTDLTLLKWGGHGQLKAVFWAIPTLTIRAALKLATGKIDVIHVHDGLLAPSGYLLSRIFRKPYVVVIHGLDITYKNPIFRAIVPRAVFKANRVICNSQSTREQAIKHGVSPDMIQVITLAVNDELYGKSTREQMFKMLNLNADSQVLLTVGRLVKRKGVSWFIESVLPDLAAKHPKLIYLVVGDGPDRPAVEESIKKARMSDYVRLLGRVGDDVRNAVYNGADVFVMPNIVVPGDVEGFGLVVLEAALCKLPVVASGIEGIKDAVANGKNGILVESKSSAEYIQEISRLLDDPQKSKKFGELAREFTLKNYNWSTIADKYIEQYKKVIR